MGAHAKTDSSFCEQFNAIENAIAEEEQKLEKLRVLKQGLMDDLLTGRVRVTHLLEES